MTNGDGDDTGILLRDVDLGDLSHLAQDLDEQLVWRRNAPLLYDLYGQCDLEWPGQTVAWLADVEGELTKLALGTRTNETEPSKVYVLELTCAVQNCANDSPWTSWTVEQVGIMNGFGLKPIQGDAPLRLAAEMTIESDVNRIAACPSQASMIAVKGSCGSVWLCDLKKPDQPIECKLGEHQRPIEGFALAWSHGQGEFLASGGNDGWLHTWDVSKACPSKPLWSTLAHSGALNDACYSPHGHQFATVGDDNIVALWDHRSQAKTLSFRTSAEPLSVDWNPHDPHLLLTGLKDGLVHIWDLRHVGPHAPMKSLKGHEDEVLQVRWCPRGDGDMGGTPRKHLLGSASGDSKVIVWNLASSTRVEEEDTDPEALFVHSGHQGGVNDFGWGFLDDFLFCSVGEDHLLQLWQPGANIVEEDTEDGLEETPAKRPRTAETLGES
ncbi:unnamed protein product [Durusdinium trenchii]|uniref:WD-40 repeat-containing protein MSI1 n=2 Tax=Durusdinium trenchii TaxID=1381693 RepID=A0ABP0S1F4_9DINO